MPINRFDASCRIITGCLLSIPISLLHLKAFLPPLCVTLTYKSLSYFKRALRLPPFSFISLVHHNSRIYLISRSFSSFHNLTPNLQLPCKPLIVCPPKPPWSTPSYSISCQLSSPCSRNDPPSICNTTTVFHLSTLPHSDITAWTDDLVPSRLGEGGTEIHIKCVSLLPLSLLLGWVWHQ